MAGWAGDRGQEGAPAWIEEQVAWYGRAARRAQRWFKALKTVQIVAAALVPFLAALGPPATLWGLEPRWAVSAIGVGLVVLEGLQQIYRFQENWISYRTTAEALRQEQVLYTARAGPYADAAAPEAVLAEHAVALVQRENARWVSVQESATRQQLTVRAGQPDSKPAER